MDRTTAQLVGFAAGFPPEPLPDDAAEATLLHLADTVACAVAGAGSEVARIAAGYARAFPSPSGATVFGDGVRCAPDVAAFVNTVMVRAYDWNDGMLARGGGHPSDMIPGILAVGEIEHATGADVLASIVLAYEVLGSLGSAVPNRDRGWDQGTFLGLATAVGIGKLLRLDAERLANAVSLTLVPHLPLRVTRTGALSMWKGAATAEAVRNAVFATLLAREGMTGPAEPFEGKSGLFEQVTGPFEAALPADPGGRLVVQTAHLKRFPAESHSQALLDAAPKLRTWLGGEDVASVDVETYRHALSEIASHPSKWAPETRETADHSLPYLLAVALTDGDVTLGSFTPERMADPALRRLMARIRVREDPAFTAGYRPAGAEISGVPRSRITLRTAGGRETTEEVGYPKGHMLNPMTRADIDAKLASACSGVVGEAQRQRIRATWWNVAKLADVGSAITTLVEIAPRETAATGTA